MSRMMIARLERIARSLSEGFARLGGCHVCRGWPDWRDGYDDGDPWAVCGGRCPICERRPELLFARTEDQAALLAAEWRVSLRGERTPKLYVGVRVTAI